MITLFFRFVPGKIALVISTDRACVVGAMSMGNITGADYYCACCLGILKADQRETKLN